MLKRIMPAPMGRAFRVRKRSNHLTIFVSNKLPGSKKSGIKEQTGQQIETAGDAAEAPKKATRKKASKKVETAA